ncbi:unnamed protein product [Bursaphelenchus xylophilus]|uniref:(pine wood nematode) hypothetical protein n=1 Tax=Bursaphelenchus xylophilus TaxID=6326 RepID=A0A1I7S9X7_BURXY|nr:unnamed protein product [Bursaphelenchus xylophilus]CAG9126200.1 unnamed protein product [Bursaphelenchus xylophilus]
MTEPSTSAFDQAQTLQLLSEEVSGCDRCYQRYYSILQNKPHLFDSRRKRQKPPKIKSKLDFQNHPLFPNADLTGGGLIEAGELGKSVLDLSTAISRASTLSPKRKAQQLEQTCKNIHLCELHLENLKKELLEVLVKKIELRIDGLINEVSDEGKRVLAPIKEKYALKKQELNERCRLQMEGLRRQLEADIDFEERNSKLLIERAKQSRLKQIDDQLAEIGCTGEDFLVNGPKLEVLESEIVEVEAPNFKGQVVLPLNEKADQKLRELERKELQAFCLYARAPERVGRRMKKKPVDIKVNNVQLNGNFWAPMEVE